MHAGIVPTEFAVASSTGLDEWTANLKGHQLSWVLASLPPIYRREHLSPALSTLPLRQHFPLDHLLGLPQDE
jgi:hypothetical protein